MAFMLTCACSSLGSCFAGTLFSMVLRGMAPIPSWYAKVWLSSGHPLRESRWMSAVRVPCSTAWIAGLVVAGKSEEGVAGKLEDGVVGKNVWVPGNLSRRTLTRARLVAG